MTEITDRLKLHRHELWLDGRDYTVITLRPGMDCRFSTNNFHDTWHILSDFRGARLLGRLLWGLSYQRVEGTLVLIDRPFLDPNPFDAEPADPIVLLPSHLTPLRARAAHQLRRRLPLSAPPVGTVRWNSRGLDAAVEEYRQWREQPPNERQHKWWAPWTLEARIDRVGGLMVLSAARESLRNQAISVHRLGDWSYYGMDYTEIGYDKGEVQVFTDYRSRVSAARVARRETLASLSEPLAPEELRPLIWDRGTAVRKRRLKPLPERAVER